MRLLDAQPLDLDWKDLWLGQHVARLVVDQLRALVVGLRPRLIVDIALRISLDLWRARVEPCFVTM